LWRSHVWTLGRGHVNLITYSNSDRSYLRFSDQCTGYLRHENHENRRGKEGLQGDSLGLGPCIPVSILLCRYFHIRISPQSLVRPRTNREMVKKANKKFDFFFHTMCMSEQGATCGILEGYLPSNRKFKLPDVIETMGFFFKATDLTGNTHSTGPPPKK